jgi:hypothetical protein
MRGGRGASRLGQLLAEVRLAVRAGVTPDVLRDRLAEKSSAGPERSAR